MLEITYKLLTAHPLFRNLPEQERINLARHSAKREWPDAALIFEGGEPSRAAYLVLSGRVITGTYTSSGQRVIYNILKTGDVLGLFPALARLSYCYNATSFGGCHLITIERELVRAFVSSYRSFFSSIVEQMCSEMETLNHLLYDFSCLDKTSCLAKRLLTVSNGSRPTSENSVPSCNISQEVLADMIGASRQTVNKVLRDWQQEQIIQINRREVVICDLPRLLSIAGLDATSVFTQR